MPFYASKKRQILASSLATANLRKLVNAEMLQKKSFREARRGSANSSLTPGRVHATDAPFDERRAGKQWAGARGL